MKNNILILGSKHLRLAQYIAKQFSGSIVLSPDFTDEQITAFCVLNDVTHIILAGWPRIIPLTLISLYKDRIINSHPGPLPTTAGLYGRKIHEYVYSKCFDNSCINFHLVTDEIDGGEILFQFPVSICNCSCPGDLEQKIKTIEKDLYVYVLKNMFLK